MEEHNAKKRSSHPVVIGLIISVFLAMFVIYFHQSTSMALPAGSSVNLTEDTRRGIWTFNIDPRSSDSISCTFTLGADMEQMIRATSLQMHDRCARKEQLGGSVLNCGNCNSGDWYFHSSRKKCEDAMKSLKIQGKIGSDGAAVIAKPTLYNVRTRLPDPLPLKLIVTALKNQTHDFEACVRFSIRKISNASQWTIGSEEVLTALESGDYELVDY